MKIIRSLILILCTIAGLQYLGTLTSGCAQIMRPTGGPKDTIPPVLLGVVPNNRTTNFTGNRVTMTFDEYIQLDNAFKNVLFSPLPKKMPFVDFKMKTVTIRLYDTLKPNKTYSIQFGNSIKDLNEGNPFGNYTYVYSTGPSIDSFSVSGRVLLAEDGQIDTTLTVLLNPNMGDSAVYKDKPEYIAKLDSAGFFRFPYLSPGTYNLFAMKDESGQYTYSSPFQIFAFDSDSIVLARNVRDSVSGILMYAYQQQKEDQQVGEGSSSNKKDTTVRVTNNLDNGKQNLTDPLQLNFSDSIVHFDSSKILLTDTLFQPIIGVRYHLDSNGRFLSLNYNWPEKAKFRLIIDREAVTDSLGHHLFKTDTLQLTTKEKSDYGTLKLNFTHLDIFHNPVVQLVKDKKITVSGPIVNNVYQVQLLLPGSYFVRILEDTNGNGKWDPGNYHERKQPEVVHQLDQQINIRQNWDNERDIDAKVMEFPQPKQLNSASNPNQNQRNPQRSIFQN